MKHNGFILTPLNSLVEKILLPMDLYKGQVCNYIMKEYVLQTLFLKLTGCIEQKAKCILWDIATYDFEFRREFLSDINPKQGEYSTFDSKNTVYKILVSQVGGIDEHQKRILLDELKDFKDNLLEKSIIKEWLPRELRDLKIKELFAINRWGGDSLFNSPLNDKIYRSLYDHRNRCAHNVLSYQGNMMSPSKIKKMGEYDYASWLTLLVLMDKIYIFLYKQFTLKYC